MDDILIKAEELGKRIRETDLYRVYVRMVDEMGADPDASKLLDDFNRLSGEIHVRQERGDGIEQFETDELEHLKSLVTGNEKILRYLLARQDYLDLLVGIQQELGAFENGFE
jgi:cell fate (sporulation/competence/biofilm development) regulator YlbF (YheA/YmcA/DUF963 family)